MAEIKPFRKKIIIVSLAIAAAGVLLFINLSPDGNTDKESDIFIDHSLTMAYVWGTF